MNIALMTNNYKPFVGGVPISVERLAKGLKAQGHQVTVFAPAYQDYTDTGELHVIRYSSLLQKFIGGIVLPNPFDSVIDAEFKKQHFDVIHVQHPMLIGRAAQHLSRKYNIPLVFTYHTRYEQYVKCYTKGLLNMDRSMPLYLHTFLKHCHHIIAPTEGMKDYLTKELRLDPLMVSILPTGIESSHFQVSEKEARAVREKYLIPKDMPLFLSVSRMADEKNVSFLLQAAAEFKERYPGPFRLLMVGDGPCKAEYEALCRRLHIDREVIFTGKIPNQEIAPYYTAADAFLFASKTETQGIVILEAFAGKAPVIALDATGVRDLVRNGKNGFLCPEDTACFAGKIQELISDPALKRALSENAFLSALEYREEAVAKKAVGLYNSVIAEQKLHSCKIDRKARTFQWNENITF